MRDTDQDPAECLLWIGRINGDLWRFERLDGSGASDVRDDQLLDRRGRPEALHPAPPFRERRRRDG